MALIKSLAETAERIWHGVPKEEPSSIAEKTADTLYNKQTKLGMATDAILTNDLAVIARLDQERVLAYDNEVAAKREGGVVPHKNLKPGGEEEGMMIADDVKVTNITRTGMGAIPALLTGGAVGLGIWAATELWNSRKPDAEKRINEGQLSVKHLSDFPELQKQFENE